MRIHSFGCQDIFSRQLQSTSFLIEDNKELILINCPPQINRLLDKIDFSPMDLTAIVITHLHEDHIDGLIDIIQFRMFCLANPILTRKAGHNTSFATEILPIYILSYDKTIWDNPSSLISADYPSWWKDWTEFHKVTTIEQATTSGEIIIGRNKTTTIEFRQGVHAPKCCGLKINGKVAISGDSRYDKEFDYWLFTNTRLVFYEADLSGKRSNFNEFSSNLLYTRILSKSGETISEAQRKWYPV